MTDLALRVRGLRKRYPKVLAVDRPSSCRVSWG